MSKMSLEAATEKLKMFRDDHSRRSDEVVELWLESIQPNLHKLSDDVWPIYEQVCVAACDCGRKDIAEECLGALETQFPTSSRVRMLRGMFLESKKQYDEAMRFYEEIKKQEPNNTVVRKREIAVHKERNQIKEAISALNKYLKDYQGDVEAWTELCDLYLQCCDYAKAAFCMEELIVFNPNNHVYFTKYADIKYTEGNQQNIETARRYYAHALRLNKQSMRALFGFYLCANHLASVGQSANKKDNIRYAAWAVQEIAQRYKGVQQPEHDVTVDVVEDMLKSLAVSSTTS